MNDSSPAEIILTEKEEKQILEGSPEKKGSTVTSDDESDMERNISTLYETPKTGRPLLQNHMAVTRSIAASVAHSVVSSSLKVAGQRKDPSSFSKAELKRISKIEKNRRQRQRRKAKKTAARIRNRSTPKDAPPEAPPKSGEIIVEGQGATLRYNPENKSVLLSLGASSSGGRMSGHLHKKSL